MAQALGSAINSKLKRFQLPDTVAPRQKQKKNGYAILGAAHKGRRHIFPYI
jgi:hypothetical protein